MAYVRNTYDAWEVQGNCGYGWETESTEVTRKDAFKQARCYRENVRYPIRIVKTRVRKECN